MAKKKTSVSEAFMDELYNIVGNLDAKISSDRVMSKMARAAWVKPTLRNIAVGGALGAAAGAASADPEMRQSRGKRALVGGAAGGALAGLGGHRYAHFRRDSKAYAQILSRDLGLRGKDMARVHKKSPEVRQKMLRKAKELAERMPLYED